jgi:hypothetical protein
MAKSLDYFVQCFRLDFSNPSLDDAKTLEITYILFKIDPEL